MGAAGVARLFRRALFWPRVEQILFPPPELWDNPNEDALVMRGLQARLAAAVLRVHSARAEQPTFSEQELEHIGSSEAEARAALRASTGTITWGSTMVPVVDMFNHAPNATSSFGLVQSSDGTFHFTLNSLHQPETGASEGEWREVFISYGAGRPSADLLACYGFCLPFPLCCDPGRPAPGSASDGGDRHSLLLRFNTAEFRSLLLADRGGEDEGGEEGEDEAAQDKLVDVFDEVEAHPLLRDAFEVDRLFWAAEVTLQRPYDPPTATNVLLVLSSALIRAIAGPEGAAARLRLEAALARLLRRRLAALRAILSSSAAPSMSTVWEMAAAFPESTALACLAASPGGEVLAATGSGVLAVGLALALLTVEVVGEEATEATEEEAAAGRSLAELVRETGQRAAAVLAACEIAPAAARLRALDSSAEGLHPSSFEALQLTYRASRAAMLAWPALDLLRSASIAQPL